MSMRIKKVEYYHITVQDKPGEAYKLLSHLANLGINLLAFTAIPMGQKTTQLTLFPDNSSKMAKEASSAGFALAGPHKALVVQGDDELGALAGIHMKLAEADVNVYASNGVTDGKDSYGYVLYIRPEKFDAAVKALGI